MTERKLKTVGARLEALVAQDRDLLKVLVKEALDQILQAEMTEFFTSQKNNTKNGRPPDESFLLLPKIFHLTA